MKTIIAQMKANVNEKISPAEEQAIMVKLFCYLPT
jgi:hypothetical protein